MVVNLQHMVLPVDQRGVVTNKLDHTHLRDPTKTRKAGGQSTVEKVHVTAFCSHTCTPNVHTCFIMIPVHGNFWESK